MTITKTHLEGYESHENTELEFHPGVNVILGPTDKGKSGVVRGIRWNTQNRPRGDEFRNDYLSEEESVRVTTTYDEKDTILREKGKDNKYIINGDIKNPLKAIKTDIPDEVQEIARMKSVNLQSQHPMDQYFLLTESPGQVAKKFNEVVGLSVMDRAMKVINGKVRTTNGKITVIEKEISTREQKLKELEWVPKAVKLANKVSKLENKKGYIQDTIDILGDTLDAYHDTTKQIDSFGDLLSAKKAIQALINLDTKIQKKFHKFTKLDECLKSIKALDKQIKAYSTLNMCKKDTIKANKLFTEINTNLVIIERLKQLIETIKFEDNKIISMENTLKNLNAEFGKRITNEACPTCGRKGVI